MGHRWVLGWYGKVVLFFYVIFLRFIEEIVSISLVD